MSAQPQVAIAVVSWNTADLLRRCLASMRADIEAERAEVWVVDNASADGSADLVEREGLPEKAFVLHQFRSTMIRDVERVRSRDGLATVQHVDGFGNQGQKLATYHAVARPAQFGMGFKLFYDEDVHRFTPAQVRKIRPPIRFVSYQ